MYVPEKFKEPSVDAMHQLIRARPLATLVTLSPGGLNANHIPMHLSASPTPYGTLRGHVARVNSIVEDVAGTNEALAIFHGADAYITPSWYTTKKETGKAVPTWNYVVVHAYGRLRLVDDAAWLRAHLEALTNQNEARFPEPWAVSDAPTDYVEKLLGAIVGLEMVVTRMSGKWKVSQNQPASNRAGVVAGLRATGSEAMAALVESGGTE
jgi:transcriptional regulator